METQALSVRSAPSVSVAIALLNEEESVPELLRRVTAVLDALPGGPHEIVLVDDGSTDGTWSALCQASQHDPRLTALSLSRNFGHQAALTAALEHVNGDVVILMDGDLQDPPEQIPRLIAGWLAGADVVYAQRASRREGPVLRACYALFYRLLGTVAELKLPLDAGDFGLMSRRVLSQLRRMPERHRYLRGLRTWVGFRQVGVAIDRDARHAGRPSYSLSRLLGLAFDGLFSFSVVPLRFTALAGLFVILLSVGYTAWAVGVKVLSGATPQGFTTLIVAITLLGGIQLLSLGIVGEYIGRLYEEAKARPHYILAARARRGVVETDGLPPSGSS